MAGMLWRRAGAGLRRLDAGAGLVKLDREGMALVEATAAPDDPVVQVARLLPWPLDALCRISYTASIEPGAAIRREAQLPPGTCHLIQENLP